MLSNPIITRTGWPNTGRTILYGAVTMCVAMCTWALVEAVFSRIPRDYTVYQVVWTRYGVHYVLVFLLFGRRGMGRLLRTRRPGLQIVRSACMLGMPVFFALIPRPGPVGEIWPAFWLAPLLVVGLAIPLLGERPPAHRWLATGLGLLGALAVMHASSDVFAKGALLALASGACFALYVVLTRRLMSESLESRLFYTAAVPFVCLTPVALFLWRPPTPWVLLLMVLVGSGGLLTLWTLDRALDLAPASFGAVFLYTQILCDMGLAALSGEMPSRRAAVGACVIVAAAAWGLYAESRRSQRG